MAEMWIAALKTNSPALLIFTLIALGLFYLIKRIETQRKDTGVKRNEQFSQVVGWCSVVMGNIHEPVIFGLSQKDKHK